MSVLLSIDVETADPWPGSICQIGMVGYENGGLVRHSWLIDPCRPFDRVVSSVHGLNAAQVAGCPTFTDIHPRLSAHLSGKTIVSYSDFDARAIGSACLAAGLAMPENVWLDGLAIARAAWPGAQSHKLRALGAGLGIAFHNKHDAEQDAMAAAYVTLKALNVLGLTASSAARAYALREVKATMPPPVRPAASVGAGWGGVLRAAEGIPVSLTGETVVFTGDVPFSRDEMAARVSALGGVVKTAVSGKTTLIVSGWSTPEAGGQKMKSAADRILDGQPIRYCSGEAFLSFVGRLGG